MCQAIVDSWDAVAPCQLPASCFGRLAILWPHTAQWKCPKLSSRPPPKKDNCADMCCYWALAGPDAKMCFCFQDVICWHTGRSIFSKVLKCTRFNTLTFVRSIFKRWCFLARGVHTTNDCMLDVLEVSWWGILSLLSVSLHGFRGPIGQMIASLHDAERASQLPKGKH